MDHVLSYCDSYMYWCLAYICEGIFDLCIYVAVTSSNPRDRDVTYLYQYTAWRWKPTEWYIERWSGKDDEEGEAGRWKKKKEEEEDGEGWWEGRRDGWWRWRRVSPLSLSLSLSLSRKWRQTDRQNLYMSHGKKLASVDFDNVFTSIPSLSVWDRPIDYKRREEKKNKGAERRRRRGSTLRSLANEDGQADE